MLQESISRPVRAGEEGKGRGRAWRGQKTVIRGGEKADD